MSSNPLEEDPARDQRIRERAYALWEATANPMAAISNTGSERASLSGCRIVVRRRRKPSRARMIRASWRASPSKRRRFKAISVSSPIDPPTRVNGRKSQTRLCVKAGRTHAPRVVGLLVRFMRAGAARAGLSQVGVGQLALSARP